MPLEDNKIPVGIYRINLESDFFVTNSDHFEYLSEALEEEYNFEKQSLIIDETRGFRIGLFYKKTESNPPWKKFLTEVAKSTEEVLKNGVSKMESFILLLQKRKSGNIYAVTGGFFGYLGIQDFIQDDFGVDIIARLIRKDEHVLKFVREKSVMGGFWGLQNSLENLTIYLKMIALGKSMRNYRQDWIKKSFLIILDSRKKN